MFWPFLRTLGTQNWPKTAQKSQFWGIWSNFMKEIVIYSKELIGTVKLHTPTMLYLDLKILGTQNWPKTARKSQFWDILSH